MNKLTGQKQVKKLVKNRSKTLLIILSIFFFSCQTENRNPPASSPGADSIPGKLKTDQENFIRGLCNTKRIETNTGTPYFAGCRQVGDHSGFIKEIY